MRPEVERKLNEWQKRWERMSETEDTPAGLWDELCTLRREMTPQELEEMNARAELELDHLTPENWS